MRRIEDGANLLQFGLESVLRAFVRRRHCWESVIAETKDMIVYQIWCRKSAYPSAQMSRLSGISPGTNMYLRLVVNHQRDCAD